jgi:APA family basic amino acid/polyamine antiporter
VTDLFARKSFTDLKREAESDGSHAALKRTLSASSLVALGIGCIIGAGIFVLTGNAAATNAGPAVSLSFLLSALVCAFAGLCYAEMASSVLEYAFGATAVAIGWSGYVVSFLHDVGLPISPRIAASPLAYDATTGVWSFTGALVNLPAMLIVGAMTALLIVGTSESSRVNNIIVAIKVTIVVLFIVAGAFYFDTANWVTAANPKGDFVPPNEASGVFGWSGVLRGAAIVFFAYIGFDAVSTAAQEAKNPRRDMPIGILGSLLICGVLYVLVSVVLTGIVPYDRLNVADPIAVGIDATGLTWLAPLVKLGAVLGLTSAILVLLLGQARIFFSMSRDGLLPSWGARIHPRFNTPYVSSLLIAAVVMALAGTLPINMVAQLVSIGTLMAFAIVCIGVLVLRVRQPDMPRAFKVPAIWIVAPAGALSAAALMLGLPGDTWMRLAIWGAIGLCIYFLYSRHHSRVRMAGTPSKATGIVSSAARSGA